MPIPKDLRGRFGRLTAIEKGLNTGDLREARRRCHAVVAESFDLFERIRAKPALAKVIAATRREALADRGAQRKRRQRDPDPAGPSVETLEDRTYIVLRDAASAVLCVYRAYPNSKARRLRRPPAALLGDGPAL